MPLNLDKLRVIFARLSGDIAGGATTARSGTSCAAGWSCARASASSTRRRCGTFAAGRAAQPARRQRRATLVRCDADADGGAGPDLLDLRLGARGQYTDQALLNYEEFSLGNLTIGRGYDPGANSGDRAIGVRGEVAAQLPLNNPKFAAQVFGFYDWSG